MLVLKDIGIAYGLEQVVHKLSLQLETGQIGCLVGPSGCGKTSILRAISGFERLSGGEISLRGHTVCGGGVEVPPDKRKVAMVFQDFALFPHLTVAQNIAFGLHQYSTSDKRARVKEMLELVGLPAIGDRYIHSLSGGQQQRIALARALAPRPDILLLDEPFSSLDAELREELARDIRDILKQENVTALMVTHDQYEAFAMADVIGVMQSGELHQWASPYELYHRPASRFVADFIGQGVLLKGEVIDEVLVKTSLGTLSNNHPHLAKGAKVDVLVRPDDIVHDDESGVTARVVGRAFRGSHILYTLELKGDEKVLCLALSHHDHQIGEDIGIKIDIEHVVLFIS